MGQIYQPGRWQEIEGVPSEASDSEILAAIRNVVRAETAVPAPQEDPAPARVSQWQPAPAGQPKQPPEAAAKAERALMLRLLDRLRG
ncbi:hypothetical protein KUV26_05365 [Leisingera daeponensis]|uniref:Uncharacterized protein n=1 Tax=Leisingera daeponensis TaxID=405746 RepID=A0ABS7NFL4_9RHOB|nr:hypothetical protein [Leisingera daeponensis]MBY6138861.1 hypothetical protein [Leisingera daeponensis]